jgi:5-methylcytosine-specific restriction enzyme A
MTGRAVTEWIGRTPDSAIPPRVRLRVFEAHGGRDYITGQKIGPADKWAMDHKTAMCNGGENRESNLGPVLEVTHKVKTASDVAERAKVARVRAKHLGLKPKRPWSKFRKRMDGTVDPRT